MRTKATTLILGLAVGMMSAHLWAAEPGQLTLTLPVDFVAEYAAGGITATVARTGDTGTALSVKVTCSDPNELYLPAAVNIQAGRTSGEFRIDIVNDGAADGPRVVTIAISADGFTGDSKTLTVKDDDVPDMLTLGGHIRGHLPSGYYWVLSQITIDEGKTLEAEPGTTLAFGASSGISVMGKLVARGTSDAEIAFTSNRLEPKAGDWTGISVEGSCDLEHVVVAFANTGISISDTTTPSVRNSTICNSRVNGISLTAYASGCDIDEDAGADIVGNHIFGNGDAGIRLSASSSRQWGCQCLGAGICILPHARASAQIVQNHIHDNGYGIYASSSRSDEPFADGASCSLTLRNNIIDHNRWQAIYLSRSHSGMSATIVNNTMAANEGAGITHPGDESGFTITNNVIAWNGKGIEATGSFTPSEGDRIRYNDVFGNRSGDWLNYPDAYGDPTIVNALGTPADATMNICVDPCFAEPGHWDPNDTPDDPNDDRWVAPDFHLKSQIGRWDPGSRDWVQDAVTSSCIDAGDPASDLWKQEPWPHGQKLNLGAYGGTSEASMSPDPVGGPPDPNTLVQIGGTF